MKNNNEINSSEKMHILHLPISLPLINKKNSGNYFIDLVECLNEYSNMSVGLLHVNPVNMISGIKFRFNNRIDRMSLNGIEHKFVVDKLTLKSIDKRHSNQWIDLGTRGIRTLCKRI